MSESRGLWGLGVWADSLTAGRALLSLPLGWMAARGEWTAVAVMLALAWWSDFLDGRLARRAGGPAAEAGSGNGTWRPTRW